MVPGWVSFKIVSVSAVLYPRWAPLLKIEISSNGQNYSILSQNVFKFELYKHNDELFSIYYRIVYELWTFSDFDRLCKLEKRGDEILKSLLLGNYWANLNQICWNDSWIASFQNCVRWSRLPTDGRQAQIEKKGDAILIVHCCFIESQNELKF